MPLTLLRRSVRVIVLLSSGIASAGGCAAPRGDSFANAVQVTPGELMSVGTTDRTGAASTSSRELPVTKVNNLENPNHSPPIINLPVAPSGQLHRTEKPVVDLSWLETPGDDWMVAEGPGPELLETSRQGAAIYVTAGYFPGDESAVAVFDNSRGGPNDGVEQATYAQPSAVFTGTLMGLETPGLEPMPPFNPNFPSYLHPNEIGGPPIVLKRPPLFGRIWGEIKGDYSNFYAWQSLAAISSAFGVGAVMANTSIDQDLRDDYQQQFGNSTKNTLHSFKFLGEGAYLLPVWAGATLAEVFFPDTLLGDTVGVWGERSLRAVLVGGPPMLLMQRVTGASRPGESTSGSHWKFFKDNNGVSGHAFIGAVSFITAAQMTDNVFLKTGFYAGSVLAGLSRINDDAHYPSQVLLGWFLAYMACTAVDLTDFQSEHVAIVPLTVENTSGIGIEFRR